MTAPDMVELGAAALWDRAEPVQKRARPNWAAVKGDPDWYRGVRETRADARAVLAAISEAGTVEWALQQKTFIDGDYDQIYTSGALYRKPFTEEEAKNHQWLDPRSPVPTRVVSRITGPWTAVEG